jgi:TonB family protein
MLFRRLLESQRQDAAWLGSAQGGAVSFAVHVAIVAVALVATHHAQRLAPPERDFFPVEYLIPEAERAGLRPHEEHVDWLQVDAGSGLGFRDSPSDATQDSKRLPLPVVKGEEKEPEADQNPPAVSPPLSNTDSVLTELEVDSTVVRYPDSAAPVYPEALLRRHVEGSVLVRYVVDAAGRPDSSSLRILYATHPEFADAVRRALPRMRFRPAYVANRPVAQLVEQPFTFRIVDTTSVRTKPPAR